MTRTILIAALGVLLLAALGNLALVGVMTRFKPERTPLMLHAPEGKEGASPYLATPPEVVNAMLRFAEVKPGEKVYDLGCGDARILVAAARDFGARGVGVELDPQVFAMARKNVDDAKLGDRVELIRGDMFKADLHSADVVALYLLPTALDRLRPLLAQQLRHGARVVTHDFPIEGWQGGVEKHIARGDGTFHTIHLYRR